MHPTVNPKIYLSAVVPTTAATFDNAEFARVAALGFDHICVDGASLHQLVSGESNLEVWQKLVDATSRHALALLLELDCAHIENGTASDLCARFPQWLEAPDHNLLPDPRHLQVRDRRLRWCHERAATSAEIGAYWHQLLSRTADLGIAGIILRGADQLPSEFAQQIFQSKATSAKRLLRIAAASASGKLTGFDLSSLRAAARNTLLHELAANGFDAVLNRVATYQPEILPSVENRSLRLINAIAPAPNCSPAAQQRALQVAVFGGDGWLMPAEWWSAEKFDQQGERDVDASNLSSAIQEANQWLRQAGSTTREQLSAPYAAISVTRIDTTGSSAPLVAAKPRRGKAAAITLASAPNAPATWLLLVNTSLDQAQRLNATQLARYQGNYRLSAASASQASISEQLTKLLPNEDFTLAPAACCVLRAERNQPVSLTPPALAAAARGKRSTSTIALPLALPAARLAIEAITPAVDGGRFAVKRVVGDTLTIEADIFSDGHDHLAAAVRWRALDASEWQEVPLQLVVNDRWRAQLPLQRIGRHEFEVLAWRDAFDTYRDELQKKVKAGLNVVLELEEGRLLIEHTLASADARERLDHAALLQPLAKALAKSRAKDQAKIAERDRARIELLLHADTKAAMAVADARDFLTRSATFTVDVEPTAAQYASWYELFPRSQSGDPQRHGTFDDVVARLPAIAAMGFDTLYFPPIHPIGKTNRKGRNNSLTPTADDPGSPYAIGSVDGGHDAIHPELGTLDDFRRLRDQAAQHGLTLALDFAIQCAPDHPWLTQHPEWFAWRPDGSMRYAENPPKKYQDIVNVDFYAPQAIPDLWLALRDVVLFWVGEGIRLFRVDNPHTKPLPFWEWLIAEVRRQAPDTLFLAEAFTRPKPMLRLAKVGFSQSYTYFTWRHTKQEFIDYMTELAQPPARDCLRPHFFVNTPDINPVFLQKSGRAGFLIRAALATTLSGLWGMYSGFELCEAQPVVAGKEEYLDSEKYQICAWDWQRPGNIIDEITRLNRIRRENPALHSHLSVRFYEASNDQVLYFAKAELDPTGALDFSGNVLLVAINLDPFHAQHSTIELPLWEFGLADDGAFEVEDLMHDAAFVWRGKQQQIYLDAHGLPFSVWRVRAAGV